MESHCTSYMLGVFMRYAILMSVPAILVFLFMKNKKKSARIGVLIAAVLFILFLLLVVKNQTAARLAGEKAENAMEETQAALKQLEEGPNTTKQENEIRARLAAIDERHTRELAELTEKINKAPRSGSSADLYYQRAKVYFYFSKFDEAIQDLAAAIKIKPRFADAYFYRGITYYKIGNDTMAKKDWEKVLSLAPDSKTGQMARENLKILSGGNI